MRQGPQQDRHVREDAGPLCVRAQTRLRYRLRRQLDVAGQVRDPRPQVALHHRQHQVSSGSVYTIYRLVNPGKINPVFQ